LLHLLLFFSVFFVFRLAALVVRQLVFLVQAQKSKTGERSNPLSRWLLADRKKSFAEFARKIACQEGERLVFNVSN
jgi:hypothetical protein